MSEDEIAISGANSERGIFRLIRVILKAALDKLAEQPNLDLAKTLLNFNSS